MSKSHTQPKIHDLTDMPMEQAYDETQTNDAIKSGDFLLVRDGVAVLNVAWPVMIEGTSKVFHCFVYVSDRERKYAEYLKLKAQA